MALFYAPDILSTLKLDEEESNHAIKVLRMKAGDSLQIVDGRGGYYEAKISDPNHKRCGVEIVEALERTDARFVVGVQYHPEVVLYKQSKGEENLSRYMSRDEALLYFHALKEAI